MFLFQEMVDVTSVDVHLDRGETKDWLLSFSDSVKFFFIHVSKESFSACFLHLPLLCKRDNQIDKQHAPDALWQSLSP